MIYRDKERDTQGAIAVLVANEVKTPKPKS